MSASMYGRIVRRVEDPRFLTGRSRYVEDLVPGRALRAVFVRSIIAHGRVIGLDVAGGVGDAEGHIVPRTPGRCGGVAGIDDRTGELAVMTTFSTYLFPCGHGAAVVHHRPHRDADAVEPARREGDRRVRHGRLDEGDRERRGVRARIPRRSARDMPLAPERVLRAIRDAAAG